MPDRRVILYDITRAVPKVDQSVPQWHRNSRAYAPKAPPCDDLTWGPGLARPVPILREE
jgi:hypothetical protein